MISFDDFEPIRPHRKDGYRPRGRVHLRIDERTLEKLDAMAQSLGLSRAHMCDVILGIAVEGDASWLRSNIDRRVREALHAKRVRDGYTT